MLNPFGKNINGIGGSMIVEKCLEGKTIMSAVYKKAVEYDDSGFLELNMSDGTSFIVVASYGGYTGESIDEYPTDINVRKPDKMGIKLKNL